VRLKLFAVLLLIAVQLLEAAHNAEPHHDHGIECPVCIIDKQNNLSADPVHSFALHNLETSKHILLYKVPCASLDFRQFKNRSPPSDYSHL